MTDNHNPVSLPVKELLGAGDERNAKYSIPMYQRNYDWGESEVRQLLQDILGVSKEKREHTRYYYIGSLVVHVRDNGVYEIIDGQQRLTTLSIILAALQNEFNQEIDKFGCNLNLDFENRDKSSRSLKALFKNKRNECEQASMLEAYEVTCRFLDENKSYVPSFCKYLMEQVIIIRVPVPKETDLNHYFEIMNNRGEQLEKHEVLKARLMSNLSDDDKSVFSTIWDACADMDRYVQLGFKKDLRKTIFGADWNQPPESFKDIADPILHSDQVESNTKDKNPKKLDLCTRHFS